MGTFTKKEESKKRADHVNCEGVATSHDVVHEVPTIEDDAFYLTHETEGVKIRVTEPKSPLKIVGPMGACRGHIAAFYDSKPGGMESNGTRVCC